MAFPQVGEITVGGIWDTAVTSHPVAMPATVNVDDLLIVYWTNDANTAVTTPSGWTLKSWVASSTAVAHGVYAKKAVGDEDGTTVDFVTAATQQATAQVYRITAASWSGTLTEVEVGTSASGVSVSPDPPALTPAGGALDYLWIASEGNDQLEAASAYPTHYTNGTNTTATASAGASTATARRELNATTDNPAVFTIGASRNWVAQTTVIPPTGATPVTVTSVGTDIAADTPTSLVEAAQAFTVLPPVAVIDVDVLVPEVITNVFVGIDAAIASTLPAAAQTSETGLTVQAWMG